ncbi:MAG: carbamoyltransferase [Paracoccaceae bacterium]|nr:carbamoyltransferase [Paracoccaceae bacterium]MDG1370167.1 carbamoyltransferase [Paracoccaceae bacterium]
MTAILGLSAYYHDSAAALLIDGEPIAAAQEERFTRKKHDAAFPRQAIEYCLAEAGITLDEVDHIAFYDKPFLKFERLLETYVANAPRGFKSFQMAIPVWIREKLFQKDLMQKEFREIVPKIQTRDKILFAEHHYSHAASAYYPSPFDEAVVLTLDGVGKWATTTVAIGRGSELEMKKELHFPHSLGLLYSAFTYYTGFKVYSGEYKVMGLAPYGEPRFKDLIIDNVMDLKEDGSYRLDQSYFNYATGLTMTNDKFADLFGIPLRQAEDDLLEQIHMDLAASVQAVTEEVVLRMTRSLPAEYNIPNLCMAGGVALNCVANGKVLRDGAFKDMWIQPAAGDAGGSLGAAYAAWHKELGKPRTPSAARDRMKGSYLGPEFAQDDIERHLTAAGAVFEVMDEDATIAATADALAEGKAVGWMNGRMEFGPRALGGRSILGDPRSEDMQKVLNLKVKFRESFRPFAPSVLREDMAEWFDLDGDSPYMLLVDLVKGDKRRTMTAEEDALFGIEKLNIKRSDIPAVTHIDYSARIQTVHEDTNPQYHALIAAFKERTGCPLVVNTSFNVRGEQIVHTPEDAFRCFMGTGIEHLTVGRCILRKEDQDQTLAENYKDKYELD